MGAFYEIILNLGKLFRMGHVKGLLYSLALLAILLMLAEPFVQLDRKHNWGIKLCEVILNLGQPFRRPCSKKKLAKMTRKVCRCLMQTNHFEHFMTSCSVELKWQE